MAIHIKPENKGKFNATKKRTGKTTEELTHSKNPLTRKRAIFAQNAKKWKHQEGGTLKIPRSLFMMNDPMYYGNTMYPEYVELVSKGKTREATKSSEKRDKKALKEMGKSAAALWTGSGDFVASVLPYLMYNTVDFASPFIKEDYYKAKEAVRNKFFEDNKKAYGGKLSGYSKEPLQQINYTKYQSGGNIEDGVKNVLLKHIMARVPSGEVSPREWKMVEKWAPEAYMAYHAYGDNIPYDDYGPASEEYTPSEEVIQSLMNYEQFLDRPSKKLDGHWTIGFGDTDKELNEYYLNHPNEKYPREKAEQRLRERVATEFAGYGKKYTPNWENLSPAQKDSLVHYIYNVGPTGYRKHHKLFEAAKKLDFAEMAKNIDANYNDPRYPGLKKRRDTERIAFLHPETTTFGTYRFGGRLKRR